VCIACCEMTSSFGVSDCLCMGESLVLLLVSAEVMIAASVVVIH
jgi:hypothetical protein